MEELRSTEVLDTEILEDARKKALRSLKTAEDTIAAKNQEWERKTKRELDSLRKAYAVKLKKAGEEIFARLPLDKKHLRSKARESFLVKAMDGFLNELNQENKRNTLIAILERKLTEQLKICAKDFAFNKVSVYYSGMEISEVKKLFKKITSTIKEEQENLLDNFNFDDFNFEKDSLNEYPSIVINTEILKITASVKNAALNLLKEKRAELAEALLGVEVLND